MRKVLLIAFWYYTARVAVLFQNYAGRVGAQIKIRTVEGLIVAGLASQAFLA